MANLNKVMLIGRLTRDPEMRTFATGGKVARFGFAVNNRRKNTQTGQWDDEPVFIDVEAFNARSDTGRQLADQVEQYLTKGRQIFIEGHLRLDQWTGQDGQKRSMLRVVMENYQFLDSKPDGAPGEGGGPRPTRPAASSTPRSAAPASSPQGYDEPPPDSGAMDDAPQSDIPF